MTPQTLAEAAQKLIKGAKTNVRVLGVKEMEELGMGAILGVGKGSQQEPKFIVAEYRGGEEKDKPVVLVGKGVTFDTGGLNIKPGDNMYEMHMDMSGGAAVLCAVALAVKLKVKTNVVALVPAVENAASGSAVRPGDILKSLSGKTIECLTPMPKAALFWPTGLRTPNATNRPWSATWQPSPAPRSWRWGAGECLHDQRRK